MRAVGLIALGWMFVVGNLIGTGVAMGAEFVVHSGSITYTETSTSNGSGTVVIGGAFADYGTDHAGALDNGTVNAVTLKLGTFDVDIARLEKALHVSTDPSTCVYVESAAAPVRVFAGTGAYKDISGTLAISVHGTGVLPRLSGGGCASFSTTDPLVAISIATGSGRVGF